jgi:hypothetical protein
MLKAPQKLPSAEQAAYRSMPEAQMVGRRYALAEVGGQALPSLLSLTHVARKHCLLGLAL